MSLAMHVQGFHNKDFYKFKRSIAWDIFGPKCSPPRLFGFDLYYGNRSGGFLYLDEDELIDGVSIQSPSDNAVRDLYAVARQVPSAIHLDAAFFVADAAFLAGIPDWLPPALPKPIRVAHSADELMQFLSQG
jgi:hypothetical protein